MIETLLPILGQLSEYGRLIAVIFSIVLGGMLAAFLLYKLSHALIKPEGSYARALAVFFGTLYALILVVTALLAAKKIGLPVQGLSGLAILLVILGGVVVFFLLPFLPRVPFVRGDLVEIRGTLGIVDALTTYQIVLHTFDGQVVYIPTPLALTSPIRNFSTRAERRVELFVELVPGSDLERARSLLLETMSAPEQVLAQPEPAVFVTGVAADKVNMLAFCWVANADWLAVRDLLWRELVAKIEQEESVQLARTRITLEQTGGSLLQSGG